MVHLVDLTTEQCTKLAKLDQFCCKLAFVPGSASCFISAAMDGCVSHFDLRENANRRRRVLVNLHDEGGSTTGLAFDPTSDGLHFVVGADDPIVRAYDLRKARAKPEPVHMYIPHGYAFLSDRTYPQPPGSPLRQ